jgi:hypothetical protein
MAVIVIVIAIAAAKALGLADLSLVDLLKKVPLIGLFGLGLGIMIGLFWNFLEGRDSGGAKTVIKAAKVTTVGIPLWLLVGSVPWKLFALL